MKRVFVVVVFIMLSFSILIPAYATDIQMGGRVSLPLGWLSGSDWIDELNSIGAINEVRYCYGIGIYFDIPIIDFIALQPEMLISSKGGAYSYDIGFKVKGRVIATGFEFPVYMKMKFQSGEGIFYILVGPDFYIILGNLIYKESGGGMTVKNDVIPDNSIVFGFSGGIGYTYPLRNGNIDVALKYDKSLTKVFEDNNTSFNGINVVVGYSILLNALQ